MVKPKNSKAKSASVNHKGFAVSREQAHLVKTVAYLREKKDFGLADEDIRTVLKRLRMPNANLSSRRGNLGITTIADRDPTDPIIGVGDPVRPGQDGDPPFSRLDFDPTDPGWH